MTEAYKPVHCNFYDELEALAVVHKVCKVVFVSENGIKTATTGMISNLYTKEGVEWLEMASGLSIRLDKLLETDGKMPPGSC